MRPGERAGSEFSASALRPEKGIEKMRRILLTGLLLLAGCQNVLGPFAPRKPERVDDPLLTIPEQERRGRDRLALPDDSPTVAPPTGTTREGSSPSLPYGR
jgi:hypothetical protein